MNKKIIIILLLLIAISGNENTVFAATIEDRLQGYTENYEDQYLRIIELKSANRDDQIKMLQDLKILEGTENGLELDRGLTRAEGSTIYLRLNGEVREVEKFNDLNLVYDTGFRDVPKWALANINYLHHNNIVVGVGTGRFGSSDTMTAEQFVTLILRGLGYRDSEGEFAWDKSIEKAVEIGILTDDEKDIIVKDKLFTRDDMSRIVYNTLFIQPKKSVYPVLSKSIDNINSHYSELFYENIDDEEVIELKKAIETPGYKIFINNPEKRDLLLNKARNLLVSSSKLFKRYINGEELGFTIKEVKDIVFHSRIEDYSSNARDIVVTAELVDPVLGRTEIETYFLWKLDGNKLRLDSDINYFGYPSEEVVISHMKTLNKNIIHSASRLGKNFNAGGIEDFANENGLKIEDGKEINRRIYSYDSKKMADIIIIYRNKSLDYHMFIELLK